MSNAIEAVSKILRYDQVTGDFYWTVDRGRLAKAGSRAGTPVNSYIKIKVSGKVYAAHRLAWLFMTGEWPTGHIDHIDGDPTNNRWENLRECSKSENLQNKRVSKSNKSGLLGVSKHKCGWQSTIRVDKKHIHLGLYKTPEEAHDAYLSAKGTYHEFNPTISRERASL